MAAFDQGGAAITSLKLFGLFFLCLPQLASAGNASLDTSVHFVALPYLHAFNMDQQQTNIIRQDKNQQDLSEYNWIITLTTLADYSRQRGQLQSLDSNQNSEPRLMHRDNIIIPVPEPVSMLLPLQSAKSATRPLWIEYQRMDKVSWHSPSLTPNIAAQVLAEQKKTDRLAERMADRAFYFGYDTNEDALE